MRILAGLTFSAIGQVSEVVLQESETRQRNTKVDLCKD